MKTYKKWQKSDSDLSKYLGEPCQIDEELFLYIAETTVPQYDDNDLTQMGEAMYSRRNYYGEKVLFYITASVVNEKYYYIGILPEFPQ